MMDSTKLKIKINYYEQKTFISCSRNNDAGCM